MNVIVKDRDILGGTPVFRGTRVPIQTLFDYLEGGETLEEFLRGFPQSRVNQPSPLSKRRSSFYSPVPRCVFYSTNALMSGSGIISLTTTANLRATLD